MKRLMIPALMLFAVTFPLVAHADLQSDEAIQQAPVTSRPRTKRGEPGVVQYVTTLGRPDPKRRETL